jgi:hypothetical protein
MANMPNLKVPPVTATFVAPVILIVKASVAPEAKKPCTLTGTPEIGVILKVFGKSKPAVMLS